ncbi:efflux RND transporter periplasmic adaptor subunit [Loktanella sp. IMCC34160]|uniref:efflux RND transporter periplasmic adaptor subunit n=1 Tax=Loktanella sp. IMCC34160 TaxID=2510646 RepID=UPI00101B7BFE|nr:efflux RND transporter periplasmic adaptor subunit [Loktanella sp. IMCC34160]RYG89819.1 efflux RND transporter periplasmic adaptor subunit [Loktanella sp. IMCC34160]
MKIMPILTAIIVSAVLYLGIFERDRLLGFAGLDGSEPEVAAEEAVVEEVAEGDLIKVVVQASSAREVDNAVILRGQTEAAREVEVRAETSGLVISDPLRKGANVSEGDLLCELNPGTRAAGLAEAEGRLAEARSRLPEAQARLPESEARRGEAQSRLTEAEARLEESRARLLEAQINFDAAEKLSEDGFASETRLANAEAVLSSARAGVTSAQAAVEGARAGIVSAEAGIEGARAAIESARAGIASAEAGVASAEKELERLRIAAPFAGLLETDAAELGALLQPGSPCATIVQLDPIKLVGFVPETDVGKISVGAMAGARLASGSEVRGQVTFIARSADPTTRTFRVEVSVPNPDLAIRDGQSADILVAAAGRTAHLLPQSALTLNDAGILGVRILEDGNVVRFAPVELMRDTMDGVWVTGLPETVDVIVVGQEYVIDGVVVAPTYREANG